MSLHTTTTTNKNHDIHPRDDNPPKLVNIHTTFKYSEQRNKRAISSSSSTHPVESGYKNKSKVNVEIAHLYTIPLTSFLSSIYFYFFFTIILYSRKTWYYFFSFPDTRRLYLRSRTKSWTMISWCAFTRFVILLFIFSLPSFLLCPTLPTDRSINLFLV